MAKLKLDMVEVKVINDVSLFPARFCISAHDYDTGVQYHFFLNTDTPSATVLKSVGRHGSINSQPFDPVKVLGGYIEHGFSNTTSTLYKNPPPGISRGAKEYFNTRHLDAGSGPSARIVAAMVNTVNENNLIVQALYDNLRKTKEGEETARKQAQERLIKEEAPQILEVLRCIITDSEISESRDDAELGKLSVAKLVAVREAGFNELVRLNALAKAKDLGDLFDPPRNFLERCA